MSVLLTRLRNTPEGMFGNLTFNGRQVAVTCELPWRNNDSGKSCIPSGTYQCIPHNGAKFKNVWEITGVPDRSAILIHNANTIRDLRGCVAVGRTFATIDGLPGVTSSKFTLEQLRSILPPTFTLTITDPADPDEAP